jgi:hypothetical protein
VAFIPEQSPPLVNTAIRFIVQPFDNISNSSQGRYMPRPIRFE